MNRRRLLKTFGLGALVAVPSAVSADSRTDRMSPLHPVAVARRVASAQLAFYQKTGGFDRMERAFNSDADRIPDDHPLKPAYLKGRDFDRSGLDVQFRVRDDRLSYWLTVGQIDAPTRFFVNDKNVIYRSTDDDRWQSVDLSQLGPDQRQWTPITRAEYDAKSTASSGGILSTVASLLNAVVPVVHARTDHGNCCQDDYPAWWWNCWGTQSSGSCMPPDDCNCSRGLYYCVQGFADCTGCCINCSGNCECVWDTCPGS